MRVGGVELLGTITSSCDIFSIHLLSETAYPCQGHWGLELIPADIGLWRGTPWMIAIIW